MSDAKKYPRIHQPDENRFVPLRLPTKGCDVISGRQYVLDPIARSYVEDTYGYRNVPKYIECLRPASNASVTLSIKIDLVSGERIKYRHFQDGEEATFRAIFGFKKVVKFTLNLEKIEKSRPFYVEADKVKEEYVKHERETAPKKAKTKQVDSLLQNKRLCDLLGL